MLFACGWVVARSSRAPYVGVVPDDIDPVDDQVEHADSELFAQLEQLLAKHEPPDLSWNFRRHMNNDSGILLMSSSRNHRGKQPTILEVLFWLAENGPGSYGLVYLHDDADTGVSAKQEGRPDYSNVFRVWRLLAGRVEELDDPFLSPIMPRINPTEYS